MIVAEDLRLRPTGRREPDSQANECPENRFRSLTTILKTKPEAPAKNAGTKQKKDYLP